MPVPISALILGNGFFDVDVGIPRQIVVAFH